jgi:hypothetical protein
MIRICGPRDRAPKDALVINTTSRSDNWSKGLSPFFLGPVPLYCGKVATNVENAWQFSKVYNCHVDDDTGDPTPAYFKWASGGWALERAVRYPMGKGVKPAYSWWDGERLTYLQARRKIYIPSYAGAVKKSEAFAELAKVWQQCQQEPSRDLWLWDFDGYDHVKHGVKLEDVPDRDDRKMGHAFVLAMLLEGLLS